MKTIVCKICGKIVEQPATNQKYCPDCRAEAYRESKKRWRWNNPERCAILQHRYHLKHADKIREQRRQYRLEHADELREYDRQYYLAQVAKKRARKEQSK